jgi:hypothetical protein
MAHVRTLQEDHAFTSLAASRFLGKKASPRNRPSVIEAIAALQIVALDPVI